MSDELNFKIKFLEQKVQVMQNEVSQVLGEMQSTIQAIAATYSTALKVVMERLNTLEKNADKLGVGQGPSTDRENKNGTEL